jgi:hypothetical protein
VKDQEERSPKVWPTLLAVLGISGATLAGLWILSFSCLSQPSSPLNLADWECGVWSNFVAVGILVVGAVSMSVAWRAISRRS